MNDPIVSTWLEGIARRTARDAISFLHLGAAYPTTRDALLGFAEHVVPVDAYLDWSLNSPGLLLINDLEKWENVTGSEFGQLRAKLYADVESGARALLVSRIPRARLPRITGSPVVFEARLIPPPNYEDRGFAFETSNDGSRLPMALRNSIFDLGHSICADLDALLFDSAQGENFKLSDTSEHESLVSAGLAVRGSTGTSWATPLDANSVRAALAYVIGSIRAPQPDLSLIATYTWTIERHIRQALRARAISLWGERWKLELIDDIKFQERTLARAQYNCPEARTITDLRDPLEWISLGNLLRLREQEAIGGLGLSPQLWRRFENDFLPIKYRLGASQLLRKDDLNIASRWSVLIADALSTSGSEDPDETIKASPESQAGILRTLREELKKNTLFKGDTEKDFMSLVSAAVRFLIHAYDTGPVYTKPISEKNAPLESHLQDAFRTFLDASGHAGMVVNEVSTVASGRADIVIYFNDGRRYVTETKRELSKSDRASLELNYLEQTIAYQSTNAPFGHLLILDLTSDRPAHEERIEESIWVAHRTNELGLIVASTLVTVVRGNREVPSRR